MTTVKTALAFFLRLLVLACAFGAVAGLRALAFPLLDSWVVR